MKKFALVLLMSLASLPLWAQSNAASGTVDLEAEKRRLSSEREAMEKRFLEERTACYKKFAVEDCLSESRNRRRIQSDSIKRQETAINDIQRQRSGAAELQKLEGQVQPDPNTFMPLVQGIQVSRVTFRFETDKLTLLAQGATSGRVIAPSCPTLAGRCSPATAPCSAVPVPSGSA